MTKSENAFIKVTNQQAPSGFVFCMAYVGAVAYFFNQDPHFWGFVLALIKAIVWPAFLVYHGLHALGA